MLSKPITDHRREAEEGRGSQGDDRKSEHHGPGKPGEMRRMTQVGVDMRMERCRSRERAAVARSSLSYRGHGTVVYFKEKV